MDLSGFQDSRLQRCYATSVKTVQHQISLSTTVRTENLLLGLQEFFLDSPLYKQKELRIAFLIMS